MEPVRESHRAVAEPVRLRQPEATFGKCPDDNAAALGSQVDGKVIGQFRPPIATISSG